MKFGFFDDAKKEYVINSPKTPYPWINYLGNQGFFSLISNTAGGYCFYKDARLRRITRYRYNNVPLDMGGRYFYINDNGTIWNPGWSPVKTPLDFYECRHGMGYTVITGKKNDLKDKIGEYLTETWDELRADIETLPPKERAMAKLKLMDYSVPKVQAVRETSVARQSTAQALLAEEAKGKEKSKE